MMFKFNHQKTLPKLAWCAIFQNGDSVAQLIHGSWVETSSKYFVEGAWDGDYDEGRFDRAVSFTGSGGKVCEQGIMFAAPTHNLERLFSIRTRTQLLISNSLVFLLTRAGQRLDMRHPNYFFDVLNHYRTGLRVKNKTLPTASGIPVHCHECINIIVRSDIRVEFLTKEFGAKPSNYIEYTDFLNTTVARIITNAQHSSRHQKYPPVTAISRGYDSTAISALAAQNGCQRAVSFSWGGARDGNVVRDDGKEIANYLGLGVTLYDKRDVADQLHPGPAEFFTNPFQTTELATQLMEQEVEGKLFLSGRHGEHFWGIDPVRALAWFQEPTSLGMAGTSSSESRLRMGYLNYPAPYTLGVYAPALLKISHSLDMRPWRIGGNYDRPIPRRMLESIGVPRKLFGQSKVGGIGFSPDIWKLPAKWELDFQEFYNDRVDSDIRSRLVNQQIGEIPYSAKGKMGEKERWLRTRWGLRSVLHHFPVDRWHHRWRSRYLYAFHWGFEHITRRYKIANSKITNSQS